MLKIEEMTQEESRTLLRAGSFGHLGCTRDNHPYVVPMNYGYEEDGLYFFTTEGTKTEYIAANHEVCFQVEDVRSPTEWRSVMVIGRAVRLSRAEDLERAMQVITDRNPSLLPALSETEVRAWHRMSKVAVYRVQPDAIYGRRTAAEQ